MIILAVEDGNIKVVQFNRPSVSLIKDQVQPLLISNGKITEDEKDAINVLESAEKGLVVNGENEILTEGLNWLHGRRMVKSCQWQLILQC